MEEVKDVKFVIAETGEVLIQFDTLKVSDIAEEGRVRMKRIIKRFLTNVAFMLILTAIICGGILGMSLLQLLFHYLSSVVNPIVGFILMMLVLGIFFTAIDEYYDRDW